MKNFLALILAVVASVGFSQNIWIADNRPTAPTGAHVFADVTSAIGAASAGDIIHLIPSQTAYTDFIITKDSLTFFGIGFDPEKDQPNKVTVANITIATDVYGTRISGINATGSIQIGNADGSLGNIFIENGQILRIYSTTAGSFTKSISNVVIRNCVLGSGLTSTIHAIDLLMEAEPTSIVITNNIFLGSNYNSSGNGYGSVKVADAIIKNNLFLGDGSQNDEAFEGVLTSTISNNVFLGRHPSIGTTNCTFSKNTSFGSFDNQFPVGVSGNSGDTLGYTNVDPVLVNVPLVDTWSFEYDPSPDIGSPLLGDGTDGNDIGVTGGTIPFSMTGTPLPVIKVLRTPEVIKQGTNLNATIEAVGN